MGMIEDRYASAVHSRKLTVDERTLTSDSDVLGAMVAIIVMSLIRMAMPAGGEAPIEGEPL